MLELLNISKHFEDESGRPLEVVRNITLTIQDQEFVALVGPSGCGKTTLLRMMAGLESAEGAHMRLEGREVWGPHRERGMVFQHFALFPWLTVFDNVASGMRFTGMPEENVCSIVSTYLELTELAQFSQQYPNTLSGGMRQRVALARTLASDPSVILMDEPFGALDSLTRSQMQEFLAQLWEREKKTVVFVTHDIEEAIFLSDRVVLLTPRPAQIQQEFAVPFPRPRLHALKSSEEFFQLKSKIIDLLWSPSLSMPAIFSSPSLAPVL